MSYETYSRKVPNIHVFVSIMFIAICTWIQRLIFVTCPKLPWFRIGRLSMDADDEATYLRHNKGLLLLK
jgi:hypothetical protein